MHIYFKVIKTTLTFEQNENAGSASVQNAAAGLTNIYQKAFFIRSISFIRAL